MQQWYGIQQQHAFNLMPTVPAVPFEKPIRSTSTSCLLFCGFFVVSRTSVGIVSLLYNTIILPCIYCDIVHHWRDDVLYTSVSSK